MIVRPYSGSVKEAKIVPVELGVVSTTDSSRGVCLEAIGPDGNAIDHGMLLRVDEDGVHLYRAVNRHLGFAQDEEGRLKVVP